MRSGIGSPSAGLRLLIVSQVYAPSHDAITQLLSGLAEDLVTAGIDVHVVTPAVNYMTGERLSRRETINGVTVWRTPGFTLSKQSVGGRLLGYASFLGLSPAGLLGAPRPDVVLYVSTPPMLGGSAPLAKWLHGAKTCLLCYDVYPEVAIRLGFVGNRLAAGALMAIDRFIVQQFDQIIVLGDLMRDEISKKGVDLAKISVIHNWAVDERIQPLDRSSNPLLARLGLRNKFVVQYSGNLGWIHDVAPIVEAASLCRDDPEIVFLVFGAGKRLAELQQAKAARELHNLLLEDCRLRAELPQSLAAADLALVSLRPEMEGLSVPSKVYGSLAAGVPVVFVGAAEGEIARILARDECGVTVQTGAELASTIRQLRADPARRRAMGANASDASRKRYGRSQAVAKYAALIRQLGRRTLKR